MTQATIEYNAGVIDHYWDIRLGDRWETAGTKWGARRIAKRMTAEAENAPHDADEVEHE